VRKKYWTEERAVQALRDFEKEHGRRPTSGDLKRCKSLPAPYTVERNFQYFSNLSILAFGDYRPQGSNGAKYEDTRLVIEELRKGRSLVELGRERGISGQALGRRVANYQRREREMRELGSQPEQSTVKERNEPTSSEAASR